MFCVMSSTVFEPEQINECFNLVCRLHEKLKLPYAALAIPMALLILVAVVLMEVFIDWQEDLLYYVSSDKDNQVQTTNQLQVITTINNSLDLGTLGG